ncbi:MAG: hypothetical protein HC830_04610 [Bacteroidetes bacterium]|nr:hypothetical protein [Bacteroidota bacterium]
MRVTIPNNIVQAETQKEKNRTILVLRLKSIQLEAGEKSNLPLEFRKDTQPLIALTTLPRLSI